jgi:hypothetical protein
MHMKRQSCMLHEPPDVVVALVVLLPVVTLVVLLPVVVVVPVEVEVVFVPVLVVVALVPVVLVGDPLAVPPPTPAPVGSAAVSEPVAQLLTAMNMTAGRETRSKATE